MNKKNIFFQILFLGSLLSLSFFIFSFSAKADLVGNTNQASLSLSPSSGSYNVGDGFNVEVRLNTNNKNVVVAAAYLKYNKSYFRANSIDTTGSIFTMEAEKTIDSTAGLIKITRGIPTPGVNVSNGLVAKVNFTAISANNPTTDNINFDFVAGSSNDSNVHLDDSKGTDILSGVYNARYVVVSSGGNGDGVGDLTPPNISAITVTSINASGATINWTTDELADSQVEYGPTTAYGSQTLIDSNLVASHSVIISGLSPGVKYHYRIKSKDAAGNPSTTGNLTFFTSGSETPSILPTTTEGQLLKTENSDKIYLIVNNQRRWITSPEVFISYGLTPGSQKIVSQSELDQYTLGQDINKVSLPEGSLLRAKNDYKVYIIQPPYKRHIFNPAIFNMYGHLKWGNIKETTGDIINSYVTSDLYRAIGDFRVYSLEEINEIQGQAIKHHLNITAGQFTDKGYKWKQVFVVNPEERDYYKTGVDMAY